LLYPDGGYGSREAGGKDHASARYIHTRLEPITRALFQASDDVLLTYNKEDNALIEPEWYMPVIPTVLINGAEGIGTGKRIIFLDACEIPDVLVGWSTNVPPYNPEDIVANIRRLMAGEEMQPMMPWWRGFRGTIRKTAEHKFDVMGVATKINDTTIEITELPIHKWTQNYKGELESMIGEKSEGPVKASPFGNVIDRAS
jgi:DNA topoisomerase-2